MGNSNKWNEHLKQFTIYASKEGKLISVDQQMADAVGVNRYAVAYYAPAVASIRTPAMCLST